MTITPSTRITPEEKPRRRVPGAGRVAVWLMAASLGAGRGPHTRDGVRGWNGNIYRRAIELGDGHSAWNLAIDLLEQGREQQASKFALVGCVDGRRNCNRVPGR
ncbi:hypothetical protein GCM10009758_17080 [Microbacterium hatanonis]